MSWDKWEAMLRGEKVSIHPQPDDTNEGYYRIPIREKHPTNGTSKTVGWIPVCYYVYDGTLGGNIGAGNENRQMTDNEVIDKWTWCCQYPITEEWYRTVAEEGKPWPDAAAKPVAVRAGTNEPPPSEDTTPLDVQHAQGIDAAIGAASLKVTNEEEASRALGSKNRLAELRLAAEKAGKALYEPPFREYKKILGVWSPIINRATDMEKKLNIAVLTFRENERRRIATEKAAADKKAKKIEEANARAADRAIAAGQPEPPPAVEEVAPVADAAPITPAYGTRKLKEEVKLLLDTVTSWELLFAHYKGNADVQALLMKLASADIKAGRTVPGTTSREGLI